MLDMRQKLLLSDCQYFISETHFTLKIRMVVMSAAIRPPAEPYRYRSRLRNKYKYEAPGLPRPGRKPPW